jgi:hypothetical protein
MIGNAVRRLSGCAAKLPTLDGIVIAHVGDTQTVMCGVCGSAGRGTATGSNNLQDCRC